MIYLFEKLPGDETMPPGALLFREWRIDAKGDGVVHQGHYLPNSDGDHLYHARAYQLINGWKEEILGWIVVRNGIFVDAVVTKPAKALNEEALDIQAASIVYGLKNCTLHRLPDVITS